MLQSFSLDPGVLSMIGKASYPTGYSLVMFPGEARAAPTVSDADNPLPSARTKGATDRPLSHGFVGEAAVRQMPHIAGTRLAYNLATHE